MSIRFFKGSGFNAYVGETGQPFPGDLAKLRIRFKAKKLVASFC
jgi:hypothetical protein